MTATNESAHSVALLTAPAGTLALFGSFDVGTAILDTVGTVAVQAGATVTTKAFNELVDGATLTMACRRPHDADRRRHDPGAGIGSGVALKANVSPARRWMPRRQRADRAWPTMPAR